jgi:phage recombination protein Bet
MTNLTTSGGGAIAAWDSSQIDIIKNQIAKGCSDGELQLFSQVCAKTGLDPFSRQIYAIVRNQYNPDTRQKEPKMTITLSIDGFRTIAARSGLYGGSTSEWCGDDGVWRDVWLSTKPPAAAKTTVWRIGSPHPFIGVARFDAYAQSYNGKLSGLWEKMPDVLIAKCSESLALRKAFPAELSGLYSTEEMDQADNTPSPPPVAYSATATQYQADLKTAFEILAWEPTKKAEWARAINPAPFSVWSDADWSIAIQKAYMEIDKLNETVTPEVVS